MAKILIVDDDVETTALFESLIRNIGHEPVSVNSSLTAIETIKAESPDLILLDIMMPDVNGIELCKMIKAIQDIRHIPIMMVSALSDKGTKRDSSNAGAEDFLTKPVLPQNFAKKIKSLFG
jgi:CheY-like chemotaxis protein